MNAAAHWCELTNQMFIGVVWLPYNEFDLL